uniref:Uncharacterized protein n=1 Tax=Anguilla anguilla TaxID=7936 RepID=A0A0E9VSP3_ANGAN
MKLCIVVLCFRQ